jgi:hypothetical protein
MKASLILILIIFSNQALSAECRLTGLLKSQAKLQTSFHTRDLESCRRLANKTNEGIFFGLLSEREELKELKVQFFDEKDQTSEVIVNDINDERI